MYDITKLIPKEQFDELLKILPTPKEKNTGRPRVSKEAILKGILQVLTIDIPWNKIYPWGVRILPAIDTLRNCKEEEFSRKSLKD